MNGKTKKLPKAIRSKIYRQIDLLECLTQPEVIKSFNWTPEFVEKMRQTVMTFVRYLIGSSALGEYKV